MEAEERIRAELRTEGDPLALAGAVRKAVHDAAPDVPVIGMMTQTQRIDGTITQERAFADLCTAFALLALIIACVGLYGTMAYAVSRRTNEIGIRMALGALRPRIVWMVLREVLALTVAGLAIGLACAWTALPAIKSFVFGIKPADPLAIFAAAGILMLALLLACARDARISNRSGHCPTARVAAAKGVRLWRKSPGGIRVTAFIRVHLRPILFLRNNNMGRRRTHINADQNTEE
ncbi:MAG TPA: FtsX-like permease family protein [Bryobacteraceae bacterium]|nr:FtsX-like permease family protein [Bryobacteraceae bacterium]